MTRLSGIDTGARKLRKGAIDSVLQFAREQAGRDVLEPADFRAAVDTVNFNFKEGHVTLSGNRDQTSTQTFSFTNSMGDCYTAEVKAEGGTVTSFSEGKGCSGKPMHWFVHPTGAPGSFGWRRKVH